MLDITAVKPLIECCTGYDIITGEDLSDFERGMKAVSGVVSLFTLDQDSIVMNSGKLALGETLKMGVKMLVVDAISTGVSYGTSEICQAMGCPGCLTLVLSLLAGMGSSAGLGSKVFKRPYSSFGKMSDGDGIRYTQYWDDVAKGLDTQTRVKLNQWNYRPNADLYNKYKNIFDNPKYYNQETGAINWPDNRGFEGNSITEVLQSGTRIDRYGYDGGTFVSPEGTSYTERALPPGTEQKPYKVYEVVQPIEVQSGKIKPWFDEKGGGIQYEFNRSIADLLDDGIIKEVK